MEQDCYNCKHLIDRQSITCEIEEPCINHFYFESQEVEENLNNTESRQ